MQVRGVKPAQLIRGGPGSGKTSHLVEAVAEAVGEGISPARILWLTLDRAAQYQQRAWLSRRSAEIGRSIIPVIETYEDIARQILEESPRYGGRGIIRPHGERLLVGEVIREVTSSARYYRAEAIRTSPQFRDDVADFIAELKRYKIDARTFRYEVIPQLPQAEALADLADIYERYQQRLREADIYDLRGIIWLALLALEDEAPTTWQSRYDLIVADDLQDATALQIELLAALCGPQTGLVVAYEPAQAIYRFRGAVEDPAALLCSLMPDRSFSHHNIQASQPGRMPPPIARIAQRFAQDWEIGGLLVGRCEASGDSSLCVYHTFAEELVGVGDQIIELLRQRKHAPEQIAVIARSSEQVEAARQHLAQRGIPVCGQEAAAGMWTASNLLNNIVTLLVYLRERDRYPTAQRQRELMQANLALYRLISTTEDDLAVAKLCRNLQQRRKFLLAEQSNFSLGLLNDWAEAIKEALGLAEEQPLAAMRVLLKRTGLLRKISVNMPPEVGQALAALFKNLEEVNKAFVKVANKSLSWEQIRSVIELSRQQPFFAGGGGVKVLLAHEARGVEAEVVYLLGLSEGAFPARVANSQLLAEETIKALRERARQQLSIPTGVLPLAHFSDVTGEARAEEARLFYNCLTRATKKLVISCHLEEDGAEVGPSEFLATVLPVDFVLGSVDEQRSVDFECVFGGLAKQARGGRVSHQDCPVTLCVGRPSQLADQELCEPEPVSRPRSSTVPILAELVPDWPLSASSINRYLSCPRRFFFEKLLNLPTEDPAVFLYGNLIHQIMALVNQLPPVQRTQQQIQEVIDQVFAQHRDEFASPYSYQVYYTQARRALQAYAETDFFTEESLAQERCFAIRLTDGDGKAHLFRGRIDHVVPDGDQVAIVDYKSGKVDGAAALRRSFCYRADDTAKEPSEKNYQLPLYALGWQKTTGGRVRRLCLQSLNPTVSPPCRRSCVEVVSDSEPPGGESITTEELEAIARYLAELARTIKQRPGFEGHPPREGCTTYFACPYVLICSEAEPS